MSRIAAAATLSVGDELMLAQTRDANAPFVAERLLARGITVVEHRAVGDDRAAIARALRELAARAPLVVVTGGLGPTIDDLTRDALADALEESLVEDDEAIGALRRWFEGRGRTMPESNRRQALRPGSAVLLRNELGTAPGIDARAQVGDAAEPTRIVVLPGPPREMRPMFERFVLDALPRDARTVRTGTVHSFGLGESAAAERIETLMSRESAVLVGTTASRSIVSARIRAEGDEAVASAAVAEAQVRIREAWGPYAYGADEDTLSSSLGAMLLERGLTVATAESCTGGQIGAAIVDVPGSSAWYRGGAIAYSNDLKTELVGVPEAVIATRGAVSEETAALLAMESARRFHAAIGVSTTGIAGPGGAVDGKPVGTVYIGVCDARSAPQVHVRRFEFPGERAIVRGRTTQCALQLVRMLLLDEVRRPLLWEVPLEGASDRGGS